MSSDEQWQTDYSSEGVGESSGESELGRETGAAGELLQRLRGWEGSDEDDLFSDDEEEVNWDGLSTVGRRDVDYYKRRWGWPLYADANITLGESVYVYLKKKVDDCDGDTSCDKQFRLMHEVLLPQPNLFPPSLYLVRKLAGVEDLDNYEYHVCKEDHYVWGRVSKAEWKEHLEDKCPVCAELGKDSYRFRAVAGGRKVPTKVRASVQHLAGVRDGIG